MTKPKRTRRRKAVVAAVAVPDIPAYAGQLAGGAGGDMEPVESRAAKLAAEFVRQIVALGGKAPRDGSGLSRELRPALEYTEQHGPAPLLARIRRVLGTPNARVLDFGCGSGAHRAMIEQMGYSWTGCDVDGSGGLPTLARSSSPSDGSILKYRGRELPFADAAFDIVWAWQSLEHIQELELTFAEVGRCLRKGGIFAGSASFLEPYHTQSIYRYTPYGFKLICERHGIELLTVQPAENGLTLLLKRLGQILSLSENGSKLQSAFREANLMLPVKEALIRAGKIKELSAVFAQLCGNFRFIARKI